jgi:hypothetical protein
MNTHVTIYSPTGEMFENVTAANARDLTAHAKWTYTAPTAAVVALAQASEPVPEVESPADPAPVDPVEPAAEPADDSADIGVTIRYTEDEFADLADKEAVRAYIDQAFPGQKIDGRANRAKLIEQAIELAATEV